MCGRYSLSTPLDDLVEELGVDDVRLERYVARYNIAPTQLAPVLIRGREGRVLGALEWGFAAGRPGSRAGRVTINARGETADRLPSFREAFRRRRCLVPADGFYEWAPAPGEPGARRGGKIPHWIHLPDRRPFTLAGLWEPGGGVHGAGAFTILTTEANERIRRLHDRMPVIVPSESRALWLDPTSESGALKTLLAPAPEGLLEAWPVSSAVNRHQVDDPSLVRPLSGGVDLWNVPQSEI